MIPKSKGDILLLAAFLLSVTLLIASLTGLVIIKKQNGTLSDPPRFVALSKVPRNVRENQYLQLKQKGCCKKLSGKVAVTVVLVSDSAGPWDADAITNLKDSLEQYGQDIAVEAEAYHTELSLSFHYYNANLSIDISNGEFSKQWQDSALKSAGLPTLVNAHNYLEKLHGAEEAPLVFAFNKPGRAYAETKGHEFLVLYARNDFHAFEHELCHIFGAEDFYYPKEVKQLSSQYLPDSVMSGGEKMDALTAYLIGWTDELTDEALQFLLETNDITAEYLRSQRADNVFTGKGTKEFDTGTYNGDLVRGERHGTGTMQYHNGGIYVGQWENGAWSGEGSGKIIYKNGAVYEGEFLNGVYHGTGMLQYANGGYYTGQWKDGNRSGVGKGKIIYKNGAVYEGEFLDDAYHGTGTMQYANGSWYTGTWDAGKKKGNGTGKTVYDDGTTYEGAYFDGERHGQGTYHYSSGSVYTGQWVDGIKKGIGTMQYADGGWYTGEWNDNAKVGVGKARIVQSNGVYEGDVLNGKQHGQGTYLWTNGEKYVGQWTKGEITGYGTVTKPDGTVTTGYWRNGVFLY